MPAPKRLIRGGGDLPRNPAHLRKKRLVDAVNTLTRPDQLELAPEPEEAADMASLPATVGVANSPKVSTGLPDELVNTMRGLLSQYNLCGVLQALTDILKE
jgi:hypothetical protein